MKYVGVWNSYKPNYNILMQNFYSFNKLISVITISVGTKSVTELFFVWFTFHETDCILQFLFLIRNQIWKYSYKLKIIPRIILFFFVFSDIMNFSVFTCFLKKI